MRVVINMFYKMVITVFSVIIINTIVFASPVSNQKLIWTQKTLTDLNTIHKVLIENTMQYEDKYPPFMYWLNNGLAQAKKSAYRSNAKAGYYYTLAYYTRGFHNGHIAISIGKLPYRYAGILLKYQHGKYLVKYCDSKYENLPPLNASLLSCGGISAQSIINDEIIPYRFVPKLSASYNQAANYLFFDANPFRKYYKNCKFQINNKTVNYHITWRTLPYSQTAQVRGHFISSYSFRIQLFGKNGLWISIPTLFPEGSRRHFMQMLIKLMPSLRSYDPIVLDVRGDRGGNSELAYKLLAGLYGKKFTDQAIIKNDHSYAVYRVSKRNIERYIWFSKLYPVEKKIVKKMQKAYAIGKKTIQEEPRQQAHINTKLVQSKFHNHIYFLTDNSCFSSCLDFADYIHWLLPNTTHIGLPTSADSPYNENNDFDLPGGAHFLYTMKVWRNRPRENNQPYIPKYLYTGSISNTHAVMKWVESLYEQRKF